MKQEILKRAMFAKPLSKAAKNSGIMAGFEDEMEMEGEEDEMLPMARTPQNPEILMNNLRGDMRSVDARYQELADMVGEQAAQDTPPQVLALLQEHMAMMQQPQGGIGGLPQGQQMAPPGMPPPGGPQGMPPGMPHKECHLRCLPAWRVLPLFRRAGLNKLRLRLMDCLQYAQRVVNLLLRLHSLQGKVPTLFGQA